VQKRPLFFLICQKWLLTSCSVFDFKVKIAKGDLFVVRTLVVMESALKSGCRSDANATKVRATVWSITGLETTNHQSSRTCRRQERRHRETWRLLFVLGLMAACPVIRIARACADSPHAQIHLSLALTTQDKIAVFFVTVRRAINWNCLRFPSHYHWRNVLSDYYLSARMRNKRWLRSSVDGWFYFRFAASR